MKKKTVLILLISCILFGGCVTAKWKESLVSTGSINDAIENAITDFIHTSKLFKQDSIFDIYFREKENILMISIGNAENKIYPISSDTVGAYDDVFPTKYVIKNEKLFYWNDSTQVISQEIIDLLDKYNHIDFHWSEEYILPPYRLNDGFLAVVYHFCKNDYRIYKKTGADNILGHYKAPKLNCSDN